ncbi:MAG TPA: ATP-dependent DNA ligase [Acidobacteriota bacterium]|nr:ATP-dependent DNA ligase [Acidobacteriota bacterium]
MLKILLGGMRIGLQESLVESAVAKTFGVSLPDVQRANMMLGDLGECALLARRGRLAEARMRLMHPLKPMLASPEEDTSKILEYMDGRAFAEDKYDGIRAHIHKDGAEIRIFSRDLDDITGSFPDVLRSLTAVPGSFLLDGEIVPFRDGRILTFGELQVRLGRKELAEEILNAVPCRYFAFDVLYANGDLLFSRPLRERKAVLESLYRSSPNAFSTSELRVVETAEQIEAAFQASRDRNNEGLVIKHPESEYTPGKRGKAWLKLKRALVTLDVVVVRAEYGHGKRRGLLSDYTFAVKQDDRLLTIGKAYSGITDQELERLSEHFHRTSLGRHGHYHDVVPDIVLEVAFDRINRSNRHTSGFALRFPRIKQIRWNKKPEEIDTLETVESLYAQHFA